MNLLYIILFFILGATLTSFYHLIGERIPKKISIAGRSYCNHCKKTLRFIDELPIIGYIINLGKCHFCKKPIPVKYLLYEIFGGALFLLSYITFGFTLELIVSLTLISVFLVEIVSDSLYQIVIDRVWIIGAVIVIITRSIQGVIWEYLLSGAILFSILFLIGFLGKKIAKKEALGGGDIKLYLFIGLAMNVWNSLLSLFLACIVALLFAIIRMKSLKKYIPLVPFIFVGVFIAYFYGDAIISWYLNLFGM